MNVDDRAGWAGRSSVERDEPIELRRHLGALWRNRLVIGLVVVVVTGVTVGVSLVVPKSYRATAQLVISQTNAFLNARLNTQDQTRSLRTLGALATTRGVLVAAAKTLPQESVGSLEHNVESSVDPNADIITISATDHDPQTAANIANTVAAAAINQQRTRTLQQIAAVRAGLLRQLAALAGRPRTDVRVRAVLSSLSALNVTQASVGSEIELAQPATAPSSAYAPNPVRNGILAFFAALLIGSLIAIGRDRLVPRVSGSRELSRLMDLPVLGRIPQTRRRLGSKRAPFGPAELWAYDSLATAVSLQLAPSARPIIAVTSALPGEGKSRLVAGLGRALAHEGYAALLISADLRRAGLAEYFDVPDGVGLADVLARRRVGQGAGIDDIRLAITSGLVRSPGNGTVDLLQSASRTPVNPARLITKDVVKPLFHEIRGLGYDFVLVDSPAPLSISDAQVLLSCSTAALVAARVDSLRVEDVTDLREWLDRLEVRPLGLVLMGASSPATAYYRPEGDVTAAPSR